MCCGPSGSGPCLVCKIVAGIVALILTLTTIAAAVGVYATHMVAGVWVFGAVAGSAALITFIVSLLAWFKVVKKMCPCRSAGCGSGCGCGGGCPGCGHDPCTCG